MSLETELPRVFGGYVLLTSLGRGGCGEVFLAKPSDPHGRMPNLVVVKTMLPELTEEDDWVRRFRHEAELATTIDDPHVAKVLEVGDAGGTGYFVQELIDGWPLSRVIASLVASRQRVALPWILEIARGVLRGLEAIHGAKTKSGESLGIVHRDVAPKNIMVTEQGVARLIDLGIGRSNLRDWETRTGIVVGSPGYMPPEQVLGRALDHRADLYAVGVVIWELSTLAKFIERGPIVQMLKASVAPPYRPIAEVRPDVPPELDRVLQRALAHAPNDRYPSATAMRRALDAVLPPMVETERWAPDDTLVRELEEERTAVRERSVTIPREVIDREKARVTQYAHHASVVTQRRETDAPEGAHRSPSSDLVTQRRERPEKIAGRTWIALAAGGVSLALVAVAAIASRRPPPPVEERRAVEPAAPKVRARERATERPLPVEAPVLVAPSPIAPALKVKPKPEREAAPAIEDAPPREAEPVEEYVDGLIHRTVALKERLPREHPQRGAVLELLSNLNLLRGSSKIWKERDRADQLAKTLSALESAP